MVTTCSWNVSTMWTCISQARAITQSGSASLVRPFDHGHARRFARNYGWQWSPAPARSSERAFGSGMTVSRVRRMLQVSSLFR